MGSVTWPISGDRERELIDAVLSSGHGAVTTRSLASSKGISRRSSIAALA